MPVFLTKEAHKQYSNLPLKVQSRIKKKLLFLESEPLVGKKLSGKLLGLRSLKVWPYRIIYYLKENQKQVWIVSILHRQGAYK